MVSLLFLGTVAERNFGRVNFLIIYLLSGLGGSLLSAVWNARPAGESMAAMTSAAPTVYLVVSAGASGAVMGLAAASIVLKMLTIARREYLPMPFSGKELAILVAINVVYGWQTNGTDNACHIGGLLAGAIVGLLLGAVRKQPATLRGVAQAIVLVAGIAGTFAVTQANASREDLQQIRQQLEEE
jgi:membrane associated rhomboid family serine protease